MTVDRSHLSLEFMRWPVTATVAGVSRNPTGDTVQFSFPAHNAQPSAWVVGSWETDAQGHYLMRVLVGPGGVFVPASGGDYDVWVKITDSPEIPARQIDRFISR